MTQSVVEKSSIPEKTWRRQTDSPKWWITFACGSLILHLLTFWLISLYKLSASQQRRSQSAVPIEFIEISPQKSSPVQPRAKPKPKPVLPKPAKPIVPQNSQPAALPNVVKPPVIANDRDAIAFDNQKIEQKLAEQQRQQELLQQQQLAEQRQQQLERQQELAVQQRQQQLERQQELAVQQRQQQLERQQELAVQQRQQQLERQQELAVQQRQQQLERQQELAVQQRQQQQELADEQRLLAQQSKLEAEEQRQLATQQQQNPLDGEKIANAPTNAQGETPEQRAKAPQAPIPNQSNQSSGILTASLKVDTNTFFKDKPANLAKPQKRVNSDIPLPPPKDGNLQLGDFLVWLTIDNEGNLLSIEVDKQIPLAQRSQYQEYAEIIFNGQKFIPASEDNGNKPDLSYLPIRVNIQSSSD